MLLLVVSKCPLNSFSIEGSLLICLYPQRLHGTLFFFNSGKGNDGSDQLLSKQEIHSPNCFST